MGLYLAILFHVAIPAAGLMLYRQLCERMERSQIENPPTIPLFILFCAYGGWIIVFLTMFFWYWSGMAAIGLFGLLFVAPLVMIGLSYYLFPLRKLSKYHKFSFLLSVGYFGFIAAILGIVCLGIWFA